MNLKLFAKSTLAIILFLSITSQVSAQWSTSQDSDEMTGENSSYAHSPSTTATERMEFPYDGTEAWLGVGCDGQSEWAYIGFSQEPNLTDTETEDGYNKISTRIKFNDDVQNVALTQDWGSKFVHFMYEKPIIPKLVKSNTVLLELNWHGNGSTYFRFSLDGSADAIQEIRQQCSKY